MKFTWLNLIIIIFITSLITLILANSLGNVSIIFVSKNQYNALIQKVEKQGQIIDSNAKVFNNIISLLKNKKIID